MTYLSYRCLCGSRKQLDYHPYDALQGTYDTPKKPVTGIHEATHSSSSNTGEPTPTLNDPEYPSVIPPIMVLIRGEEKKRPGGLRYPYLKTRHTVHRRLVSSCQNRG